VIGKPLVLHQPLSFKSLTLTPKYKNAKTGAHYVSLSEQKKAARPTCFRVTLAFASHLLSPTMSDSEIGGEPAISYGVNKTINNPMTRFTSLWNKQIPSTHKKAITHEDRNRTPKTL